MNVNSTSTYTYGSSASKGMSGLASGLDTESLVKEMLSGTQSKIDKQEGLKQQTEWKQEIYRDLISQINTFQTSYFSSGSSTSLTSSALYNAMTANTASKNITVTASTSAPVGNTSISVHQLASNYSISSGARVSGRLAGTMNLEQLQKLVDAQVDGDRTLAFNVGAAEGGGSTTVKINLRSFFVSGGALREEVDAEGIAAEIQKQLKDQAGLNAKVSMSGGQLSIVSMDGERSLGVSSDSSALALTSLGLTVSSTAKANRANTQRTLTSKTSLTPALHFNMTLDGSLQKDVALDVRKLLGANGKVDAGAVSAEMKKALDQQFGKGTITVTNDDNGIELSTAVDGRKIMLNNGTDKAVLKALGFTNGQSNRIEAYNTLKEMQLSTPLQGRRFEFEINGAQFAFSEDDDIDYVMNTINSSEAGVTIAYKPLEDRFVMTANDAGAGRAIRMNQTEGNLLNVMFGSVNGLKSSSTVTSAPLTSGDLVGGTAQYTDGIRSGYFSLTVNGKEYTLDLAKSTEPYTKEDLLKRLNTELSRQFGTLQQYDDEGNLQELQNIELLEGQDGVITLAVRNGAAVELAGVKGTTEEELEKLAGDGNLTVALGLVQDSKGLSNVMSGAATLKEAGLLEALKGLFENDDTVTLDDNTTLEQLAELTKNAAVQISFADGRLVVSTAEPEPAFSFGTPEQMQQLFGAETLVLNAAVGEQGIVREGRNAIVSIDGMLTERNSNVFTYNGMTVELNAVSKETGGKLMVDDGSGGLKEWTSVNGRWVDAQGYERAEDGKYVAVNDAGKATRVESEADLPAGYTLKRYPSATFVTADGQQLSGIGANAEGKPLDASGKVMQLREAEKISVTRDTDKIVDSIKNFVDEYNKLVKTINDYLNEDANYRDYAPLTDEQRKEMSEKQIELWEEKAKEGLLRRDSILSEFLQSMRSVWYETNSSGYAIYQLGIETGEWSTRGQLTLSADGEATLRNMLASDPTGVMNFFANTVDGAAVRVNDVIRNVANTSSGSPGTLVQLAGIKGKASETNNTLYDQLKKIDEQIERLKNQYEKEKDRYWKQFNSMEQAISDMNSQSAYLAQLFTY